MKLCSTCSALENGLQAFSPAWEQREEAGWSQTAPFALCIGACGLCGEQSVMAFLNLVFPKRMRNIFYSLVAKMCDFILQKNNEF